MMITAPSTTPVSRSGPVRVLAAGCVVWRPARTGPEVALIHRPRYDDWSFPKGKLDLGESYQSAAIREVFEETGFHVLLGRRLPTQVYDVTFGGPPRRKKVKYWAAHAALDVGFEPNDEVDRLEWLPVGRARKRLSRQADVDLLGSFAALPVDTTPVLLLRHATALPRKHWPGPDDERPLTLEGQAEALRLPPLFAAYGDFALVTSPYKRCLDTLEPMSRFTGDAIAHEEALGEESDPEASRKWLRDALASGRAVVGCTHRPVLPELMAENALGLAVQAGRRALAPAEAWVLHGREGGVVAIDRMRL